MELHRPGALAQPIGLTGGVVLGEQLGARGKLEVVVVPLERLEPGRHDADHRVLRPACVEPDLVPAHLVAISPRPTQRPRRAGDQLRPEADPEERDLASSARRRNAVSSASQGCSASWSGCIAPPNTMIAS